ncbi:MAG: S1-like domain-containing RNA-binding protein [Desulfobacterales bacterium]|nr:S1-like domain-containing RNA-binding protein [Desulfobacterales bacterium]MDD4071855.1 S1-like domain-containing RNA-binding protein [Desulfobacterales bacterium]MDD4391516.1 S1-like domain-containing RNA-binding protein [Desulfobacterales bacterium]
MLKIGSYNELVVQREVDFGVYLNPKEEEVLLPAKYVPENTRPGDKLRVFVYTDSQDRVVATTREPYAVAGEFAYLEVLSVVSFGAFVDWGLEKDLLVPKNEQQVKMKVGKKYIVKVCLDKKTGRVYASTKIAQNCKKIPSDLVRGSRVSLLIYRLTTIGIMAIVDNKYSGLLYRSQSYEPLSIGDKRDGYIIRIREDGKIDLSLKQPGYGSVSGSSARVIGVLKRSGGFIGCDDKSSPEDIKKYFSMSKKEFKRTIGGLYKSRLIEMVDNGIRLKRF